MDGGQSIYEEILPLIKEMKNKDFRDQFIESFSRQRTARQMRQFRGDRTQDEFGAVIDKSQTQVARFEDPNHGWHTRTVFEVARKMNVAALVCFLSVEDFMWFVETMGDRTLTVAPYSEAALDQTEWWDVCRKVRPDITEAEFEAQWAEFQTMKANKDKH